LKMGWLAKVKGPWRGSAQEVFVEPRKLVRFHIIRISVEQRRWNAFATGGGRTRRSREKEAIDVFAGKKGGTTPSYSKRKEASTTKRG